jgi:glyoxylase-like metal-dependent hydrolase (beta-lactamase superfamily II)
MREVADGVFEIGMLFVHAHLVVVDDGVVLVDTGLPGRSARIVQALREARTAIGNVRTILLTHWHADHTGNAADLRRRSGARIVAHAIDAAVISGAEPLPLNALQRLSARLTGTPEPVRVDETLRQDGPFSATRPGTCRSYWIAAVACSSPETPLPEDGTECITRLG